MSMDFDEADWAPLQRRVWLSPSKKKFGDSPTVSVLSRKTLGVYAATLVLRGARAAWAVEQRKFRVDIGGAHANMVRLTPDASGEFIAKAFRGVAVFRLGRVPAWPAQPRETTPALAAERDGALILTLPEDFARAASSAPARPGGFGRMVIDRTPSGPVSLGEPAPGRSAFDARERLK